MAKKPKKKKKDNEIRLRFIPDELFNKITKNADNEKRSYPDEVILHLEKTYK